MEVRVYDMHFSGGWITLGELYLRRDAKPGWSGKLPFYIVKCPKHGYFLDYPQGWNGLFYCLLCNP